MEKKDKKGRINTYLTAYNQKETSEKERIRVESLKLLVFKLASHNSRIQEILKQYTSHSTVFDNQVDAAKEV